MLSIGHCIPSSVQYHNSQLGAVLFLFVLTHYNYAVMTNPVQNQNGYFKRKNVISDANFENMYLR